MFGNDCTAYSHPPPPLKKTDQCSTSLTLVQERSQPHSPQRYCYRMGLGRMQTWTGGQSAITPLVRLFVLLLVFLILSASLSVWMDVANDPRLNTLSSSTSGVYLRTNDTSICADSMGIITWLINRQCLNIIKIHVLLTLSSWGWKDGKRKLEFNTHRTTQTETKWQL